jgi:peptidoglycan/LPS O-acetylase OafA/YrhL
MVIGVGWFLGVIFVFYMVFPFFCYLLQNKIRAWAAFGISLIWSVLCSKGYFNAVHNEFLFYACYFLVGGIVYLYRKQLAGFVNKFGWIVGIVTILPLHFFTWLIFLFSPCCHFACWSCWLHSNQIYSVTNKFSIKQQAEKLSSCQTTARFQ